MRVNATHTPAIERIWRAGDFTGDKRPTARCTIQRAEVRLDNGGPYGQFSTIIFGLPDGAPVGGRNYAYPVEIPNIKSVSWNRDISSDVASATIEIYNTKNDSDGKIQQGYFTWNRGKDAFSKARGITSNDWYGLLVPDNIIRTFEGYGADWTVGPEMDTHLLGTGNWLIDKVAISQGLITITARDFGRILIDQILFPPITPRSSPIPGIQYPIQFDSWHTEPVAQSQQYTPLFMNFDDSSNTPWVGHDGFQAGHYAREAMDGNAASFWLSVGNGAPNADYSFEWVQGRVGGQTVGAVDVTALYPNMHGYVSIYANGSWQGGIDIPYNAVDPVGAPNGSNIKAAAEFNTTGVKQRVTFGPFPKTSLVRVTFTNLQYSGIGPYVYRSGVRELSALAAKGVGPTSKKVKGKTWNYGDYTDIVKLLLAWGGFHWPVEMPFVAISEAPGFPNGLAFPIVANPPNDTYLQRGRVWGDIEQTGTYGIATLTVDQFDKKTIMDAITMIRDIVGFIFFVDEQGGAIWRSPNYKERGNLINGVRSQRFIRLLDTQHILDISATLDSRNARERIYVASPDGKFVGGARGYNLNPIGLRRIAGWIDEHWTNSKDCQIAAQLTAIAQMMTYRTIDVTIAGLPTMQVDDQFEVVDTTSGEGYLHYLSGIQSKLDHSQGTYTYTLSASWLGAHTGSEWAFDKYGKLSPDLEALLDRGDRGRKDGAYDSFATVTVTSGTP